MPPPTLEESMRSCPALSLTDIQYLREWLTKQPHLPPMWDEQLVWFLNAVDYSLERTKLCIDKFFTIRSHAPEIFGNRDVELPQNVAQRAFIYVAPLPRKDCNGYTIVGFGLKKADLTNFDSGRCLFLATAMMEVFLRDNPTLPGYTIILDAQNLEFTHIARTPIMMLKKLLTYIQEGMPVNMKAVHVIHVGPIVEKVMMIIKPFLSEELLKIMFFHSGAMKEFYEVVSKDILPPEFGGTCGSLSTYYQELLDKAVASREWVMKLEEQQVNENLRPGKAKNAGDVFGMEGSFKKLEID